MNNSNLEKLVSESRNEELKIILQNIDASELIDVSGMTLLHLAAKHNNLELMWYLLSIGHDVDAKNIFESTPLMIAMYSNGFEAMKILLQSNADIFLTSTITALMSKIDVLPADVMTYIIINYNMNKLDRETKANLFARACPTLQFVVYLGDYLATVVFLERNENINLHQFNDAIEFAMKQRDVENVRVVLECMTRRNITKDKFSAMLYAFFRTGWVGNVEAAKIFLKRAMEWNIIDRDAVRYFESIFSETHKEAVQILLDNNFDVYVRDTLKFELLISLFENPTVDATELVKNRSFDVNEKNTLGMSALHLAVKERSEKNVIFLLDKGADPNAQDAEGRTPLQVNLISGTRFYGDLLLMYGADIQFGDQVDTALVQARMHNPSFDFFGVHAVAQLALDDARGIPIKKPYRDEIESKFRDAFKNCSQEVGAFKNLNIMDSLTLFDLLIAKPKDIVRHASDCYSKVANYSLECQIHSFYFSILTFKLLRATKIDFARSSLAKIISQKTGIPIDSDHLAIEKIFSFLTYYDMLQIS